MQINEVLALVNAHYEEIAYARRTHFGGETHY